MATSFFKVHHGRCFTRPLFRPFVSTYVSTLCFDPMFRPFVSKPGTCSMSQWLQSASFLGILLQKTCWLQLVLDGFLIQRSQKAGCDKMQMRVDGDKGPEG